MKSPGYQIERSVFELDRTQSNENRTIKFDVVRSSNEIELTKNKCESNQIECLIKFDEVRFSSVAERYLSGLSEYVVSQYNLNRAKSITISARFDLVIGKLNASLVVFYLAMQKYFAWITLLC